MVSLDSGFVLDCVRGVPSATDALRRAGESPEPLYISVAARAAVISYAAHEGESFRHRAEEFLGSVECLDIDPEAVGVATAIAEELAEDGRRLDGVDLFVAACARQHRQRVLSRNPELEQVRGLVREPY